MDTEALLNELGYAESPNCLRGRELDDAAEYGHIFRRANEGAGLDAVYCLRGPSSEAGRSPITPISYICKAASFDQADQIHRLVWNQNSVPFLVVLAPQGVRVYTGFDHKGKGAAECLIESSIADVASKLEALSASSIDSGLVWERLGKHVRADKRVEWRLLHDLEQLEKLLTEEGATDSSLIHTLIGKLLYLHYLRHRGVLSDARLSKWGLSWNEVASRSASMPSFSKLCQELDGWLNGSVFPLSERSLREIGVTVLRRAAGVFAGDSPHGQLHLGFSSYDFSYIPIETLSVVYEQFLHLRKTPSGVSAGKKQGAYYTPVPVVNFMIDRLDEVRPLQPGMRVLDPSCGSGAFLVQCYRKLIEDRLRSLPDGRKLRPVELRELLVSHIFGIDVDVEACRVAELSLLLTMLDYIEPPDLTTTNFKLPNLSGTNVIAANAFDDSQVDIQRAKTAGFDWVIGNPPWNDLKSGTKDPIDAPVLDWMMAHKTEKPTGGNQTAEAFAWRSLDFVKEAGAIALLVPAMLLFKDESKGFRQRFFSSNRLAYVANFSNLAEVLFSGRSRVPAAALFLVRGNDTSNVGPKRFPVFSPLVANQELTRPRTQGTRVDTWSIVVDENECRAIERRDAERGEALTWKLAAWGSDLDRSILRRTGRLATLRALAAATKLKLSEGMQLRGKPDEGGETVERHAFLAGQPTLDVKKLANLSRRIFTFPPSAIVPIPPELTYVRAGRFTVPDSVSRPPHVLIGAARNWSVFTNQYLVVPARQIGIAGRTSQSKLLKALTLYLNSDFVQYHQFFLSTQAGVQRQVSTLAALRALPIPKAFAELDEGILNSWANIHDQLVSLQEHPRAAPSTRESQLMQDMNAAVGAALHLSEQEQIRVSEFIGVILGLRDGKVETRSVHPPTEGECQVYADWLKRELDSFVGGSASAGHSVTVWRGERHGLVEVDLTSGTGGVIVRSGDDDILQVARIAEGHEKIQKHLEQWRYFNRNLRLFARNRVYLFKPLQNFHWLASQAILDAAEVLGLVLDEGRP